jgi:ATP-dependent Clp protease ATP-binding subunit ClpX
MNSKNHTSNNKIGFLQDAVSTQKYDTTYGGKLEAKDFIKNGMTQEFIGRFPVIVQLNQLTEEEIYRIMIEPKNSVVTQYQKLVKCIGSELVFEEELLKSIAKNAVKNGTGARGLRTILENAMMPVMYTAPSNKNIHKIVMDVDKNKKNKVVPIIIEKKKTEEENSSADETKTA